jgi:cell division protein ZipA
MPELRWALIGLGLAFFAGLVVFEWRRKGRSSPRAPLPEPPPRSERPRRIEPGFDAAPEARGHARDAGLEVPVIHPVDPPRDTQPPHAAVEPVPVAAESAVDVPSAARGASGEPVLAPVPEPAAGQPVAIRWPPDKVDRALTLRVVGRGGMPLAGRALRIALEGAGFVPGPQSIYHRVDAEGGVLASAASMVQPGTLEPAQMDGQQYRGIALFGVLPGPLPAMRMLEGLVDAARALARRLDATVQDGHGAELDAARLEALRQSLPEEPSP